MREKESLAKFDQNIQVKSFSSDSRQILISLCYEQIRHNFFFSFLLQFNILCLFSINFYSFNFLLKFSLL